MTIKHFTLNGLWRELEARGRLEKWTVAGEDKASRNLISTVSKSVQPQPRHRVYPWDGGRNSDVPEVWRAGPIDGVEVRSVDPPCCCCTVLVRPHEPVREERYCARRTASQSF